MGIEVARDSGNRYSAPNRAVRLFLIFVSSSSHLHLIFISSSSIALIMSADKRHAIDPNLVAL